MPRRPRLELIQELQRRQQEALEALDRLEKELEAAIRRWTLPQPQENPPAENQTTSPQLSETTSS